MKEALLSIKNFLEKNGLIKIIVAFAVLIISVLAVRGDLSNPSNTVFAITGYISLLYVIVAGAVYTIVGIVNSIKDLFKK
jgi:hypothetical protein